MKRSWQGLALRGQRGGCKEGAYGRQPLEAGMDFVSEPGTGCAFQAGTGCASEGSHVGRCSRLVRQRRAGSPTTAGLWDKARALRALRLRTLCNSQGQARSSPKGDRDGSRCCGAGPRRHRHGHPHPAAAAGTGAIPAGWHLHPSAGATRGFCRGQMMPAPTPRGSGGR